MRRQLRRFTIAPGRVEGRQVSFDRQESRHLARVLRLRPGDIVLAADGRGREYTVRIERLGPEAVGTVLADRPGTMESPLAITLVQGIPRSDKMEAIVRAATELGIQAIQPVIAERTVVRLDAAGWRERSRRWQRVAQEATKQCGRAVVPPVSIPRPVAEWLATAPASGLRLCLWEGQAPLLDEVVPVALEAPAEATVLVGPEGGWTVEEVSQARQRGWVPVSLGSRILRTETAGLAIVAILQHRHGDLGRIRNATP